MQGFSRGAWPHMLRAMRPRSLRAAPFPRIALFSDVDGTLLDASDRLALAADDVAMFIAHVELILASSRTLAELGVIQRRLGITAPMIGENGAVVSFPAGWRATPSTRREIVILGDRPSDIIPRIHRCAAQSGVQVVNQKHLLPDRGRSLRRGHSVCVRDWRGESAERFLKCLAKSGLEATRSGRWITITSGPHKGTGVRTVLARARKLGAGYARVVAVGNAPNDRALLAAARERFTIRNPRQGQHPALLDLPDVIPLSSSGRRAWRELLELILARS